MKTKFETFYFEYILGATFWDIDYIEYKKRAEDRYHPYEPKSSRRVQMTISTDAMGLFVSEFVNFDFPIGAGGVYGHVSSTGDYLYVGKALDIYSRNQTHIKDFLKELLHFHLGYRIEMSDKFNAWMTALSLGKQIHIVQLSDTASEEQKYILELSESHALANVAGTSPAHKEQRWERLHGKSPGAKAAKDMHKRILAPLQSYCLGKKAGSTKVSAHGYTKRAFRCVW